MSKDYVVRDLAQYFMSLLEPLSHVVDDFEECHKLVRNMFDTIDTNREGTIDWTEALEYFKNHELVEGDNQVATELARQMMDELDTDKDGRISFDEIWNNIVQMKIDAINELQQEVVQD